MLWWHSAQTLVSFSLRPGSCSACPPARCLSPLPPSSLPRLLPCLQGGASSQFSAIPLNLCEEGDVVDYIVTGSWSKKAAGGEQQQAVPASVLLLPCMSLSQCVAG